MRWTCCNSMNWAWIEVCRVSDTPEFAGSETAASMAAIHSSAPRLPLVWVSVLTPYLWYRAMTFFMFSDEVLPAERLARYLGSPWLAAS